MTAKKLKTNLFQWADSYGLVLRDHQARAGFVNFDYRGWHFGNRYLVGDAAGLSSGLTGEGIFPAIVSGEVVGTFIGYQQADFSALNKIIKNNKIHKKIASLSGVHPLVATILSEIITFGLRRKIIDFSSIEMAH
jgi:geranylgeranyl reductase